MRRRSFLRKSIVSGSVVPALATTVGAENGRSDFEGIVYDPVTREVFGTASADLSRTNTRLKGALEVQSDRSTNLQRSRIPLDVEREAQPSAPADSRTFQATKRGAHAADDQPLRLNLTETPNNVTGVVIPPGAKRGGQRLGVSLAPVGGDLGPDALIDELQRNAGGR